MIQKTISSLVLVAVLVAGGVAALTLTRSGKYTGDGRLTVMASYYPLYDFAKQVGGEKVEVINMTPAGAEPHDYEPSARSLVDAHNAAVFIYNGGPMEPWVDNFLKDYKHTAISAKQGIDLIESEDDGHGHGHGHDHHGHDDHHDEHHDDEVLMADPHFWLDPVLAQRIVDTIRDGFITADPSNEAYYTENASRYNAKLSALDQGYATGLSSCKLDTAISSHGAFAYLAHRYGFEVASIAGVEPGEEPTVAKLAELTELVRQKGIRYIFFESLVSPRLAETIASETGASTLIFDPIEGLSQADQNKGRDYISVQYDNLENLKKALECN